MAKNLKTFRKQRLYPGGGHSTDAWVGRCGAGVETLTLFKTQFSDFTHASIHGSWVCRLLLLHSNVLRSSIVR